jgi:hypothetical protein
MRAPTVVFALSVVAAGAGVFFAVRPRTEPIADAATPAAPTEVITASAFGTGPARFEPNRGQSRPDVRWLCRGTRHTTFVGDGAFTTVVPTGRDADGRPDADALQAVTFRFAGARPSPASRGEEPLPSSTNYFVGADSSKWIRDVPHFAQVRCENVWPGIDVRLGGRDGRLEYDFLLAPGADPETVAFDVLGADALSVDARGDLVVRAGAAEIRHQRPAVIEDGPDGPRALAGTFVLDGAARVRFRVAGHDAARPLVIDPVQSVSVRVGGSGNDSGMSIAPDPNGGFAICGQTASADLPTQGTLAGSLHGTTDGYIAYFDYTGTPRAASVRSLFVIGSGGDDALTDVQIGPDGTAAATGYTTDATTFPKTNAPQVTGLGGMDAVVVVIDGLSYGLMASYPIGGAQDDLGTSVAVLPDATGATTASLLVGVISQSNSLPFLTNLPSTLGHAVVYKTTQFGAITAVRSLGGTAAQDRSSDGPLRLALRPDGNVVAMFSQTQQTSDLFVSSNAYQIAAVSSPATYAAVLNPATLNTVRATWVSGPGAVVSSALTVLSDDSVAVGGTVQAGAITTSSNAAQPTANGAVSTGFATILSKDMDLLVDQTYAGGNHVSRIDGVIGYAPSAGSPSVYFSGSTDGGLSEVGGGQAAHGGTDVFVAKQLGSGGAFSYVSLLGSAADETSSPQVQFQGAGLAVGRPATLLTGGQLVFLGTTTATQTQLPLTPWGPQGATDSFVTTDEPPVPIGPFSNLSVPKGLVFEGPAANDDKAVLHFTFGKPGDGADFGTVTVGSAALCSLQLFALDSTSKVAPLLDVQIPLNSSGWTSKAGGNVLVFSGTAAGGGTLSATLNLAKRSAAFSVKADDLPFRPLPDPALVDFQLGNHAGSVVVQLVETKPGDFVLKAPETGLKASLTFDAPTIAAGDPFHVVVGLRNYDATPRSTSIEVTSKGLTPSLATAIVPARDAVTLLPGLGTARFAETIANAGLRKFVVDLDGAKAASATVKIFPPPPSKVVVSPLVIHFGPVHVNAEATRPIQVTNGSSSPIVLTVPLLTGDWAIFPNGQVSVPAGGTTQLSLGVSSLTQGPVSVTFQITGSALAGGEATVKADASIGP